MAGRFSVEAVFKAVDKLTAPVSRMQNRVGKFTRAATKGMKSLNKATDKTLGAIVSGGTTAIKVLTGLTVTASGLVTLFNKASVEADMLANSVQFNVDKLEAIAGAVAPAGFQLDNVVDLIEEMNNKLGESAGLEATTPVLESLKILGLRYREIIKLSPEKQFEKITNAALGLADAQKAASAADILLGGEANKIIGVLRQQGRSLDEIIAQQERLNFRTKESRRGAREFVRELQLVTRGVTSLGAEISGLVGAHLAPLLKRLTDWAAANKEVIAVKIVEFLTAIVDTILFLIENFQTVTKWARRFAIALGVLIAFSVVLKTLIGLLTLFNLVAAANPIALIVIAITAMIAAVAAAVFWWDELIANFHKLPAPVKVAVAIVGGLVDTLTKGADLVLEAWSSVSEFFKGVIADLKQIVELGDRVATEIGSFFSDDDEDERRDVDRRGRPRIVSPASRVARSIEEQRTSSNAEVTIRDETGRAEVTSGALGSGLKLQNSGAF